MTNELEQEAEIAIDEMNKLDCMVTGVCVDHATKIIEQALRRYGQRVAEEAAKIAENHVEVGQRPSKIIANAIREKLGGGK